MSVGYAQARRDYEFLYSLIEVHDEICLADEVNDLMANPTKAKAADMYCMVVEQWFSERRLNGSADVPKSAYRRVRGIAYRHYQEWEPSHD